MLNLVDWITGICISFLGFVVLSFVLACLGKFVSIYRFGPALYAFCVALGSAYSASFSLNILALVIQGELLPRNAVLPAFTWLLVAAMCLWQALLFGPKGSGRPVIWAYLLNGTIAVIPVLFAGHKFTTLFTALPLFGVAVLLKFSKPYLMSVTTT